MVILHDVSIIPLRVINQCELILWLYKIVNNRVCRGFQLVRVQMKRTIIQQEGMMTLWFPTSGPTVQLHTD
jgi:hypothetical protein